MEAPEYLELPESLIRACNEEDKDNVSSESGGGASSGGSIGSTSNAVASGGSTAVLGTASNATYIDSQSIRTDKAKDYISHNNRKDSRASVCKYRGKPQPGKINSCIFTDVPNLSYLLKPCF